MLEYVIGMTIISAGFALFCLAIRWLLSKMGASKAGTMGTPEAEEKSLASKWAMMTPDDPLNMGPTSSRWDTDK